MAKHKPLVSMEDAVAIQRLARSLEYISVQEAASKWVLSDRRVRYLCEQGKIQGAVKEGKSYKIPAGAIKPLDGRESRWFNIPECYREQFSHIDSMKRELDRRRPLTPGELARLRDDFTINYTYNTNAIEGSTLTLSETRLVLEGVTIDQKPLNDHLAAVGHRDAFQYMISLVSENAPLTERTVKELHSLVLMDRPMDRGVYRRIPVMISGATHKPPQPYLVEPKMEQLVLWFNKNEGRLHPLQRLAQFHLDFEGVHPFIDGNGRTGRLLLNFGLMKFGYLPIDIKFTDRRKYYAAFEAYYGQNNVMPMVQLIADYEQEALQERLDLLDM